MVLRLKITYLGDWQTVIFLHKVQLIWTLEIPSSQYYVSHITIVKSDLIAKKTVQSKNSDGLRWQDPILFVHSPAPRHKVREGPRGLQPSSQIRAHSDPYRFGSPPPRPMPHTTVPPSCLTSILGQRIAAKRSELLLIQTFSLGNAEIIISLTR